MLKEYQFSFKSLYGDFENQIKSKTSYDLQRKIVNQK